jgi:tetratricopeptide (TPR) repeat protein
VNNTSNQLETDILSQKAEHLLKKLCLISLLFISINVTSAQKQGSEYIDSLKLRTPLAVEDTNKAELLAKLSFEYYGFNTDLGIKYGEQALVLSQKLGWKKGIAWAYNSIGSNWAIKSNYPRALECYMKSLSMYTEIGDKKRIANASNNLGWLYNSEKEYAKAFGFLNKAIKIYTEINDVNGLASTYANLGIFYSYQGNWPVYGEKRMKTQISP